MIPSIFEYMPSEAGALFQKIAAEEAPVVIEPSVAPPDTEKKPTHPYVTALKQLLPIGAGITAGYLVGRGAPYIIPRVLPKTQSFFDRMKNPNVLTGVSTVAGSIATLAASMLSQARQAEADRANKEYKDYFARRAGDRTDPSVQSPPVHS